MDLCNELQRNFSDVILPQNFCYKNENFDKLNGVAAILIVLNYDSNFF